MCARVLFLCMRVASCDDGVVAARQRQCAHGGGVGGEGFDPASTLVLFGRPARGLKRMALPWEAKSEP